MRPAMPMSGMNLVRDCVSKPQPARKADAFASKKKPSFMPAMIDRSPGRLTAMLLSSKGSENSTASKICVALSGKRGTHQTRHGVADHKQHVEQRDGVDHQLDGRAREGEERVVRMRGSSSSSAIENCLTLRSEIRSGGDCAVSRVLAFIIA